MLQIFEEREEVMWKSGKGATKRAPVGANNLLITNIVKNSKNLWASLLHLKTFHRSKNDENTGEKRSTHLRLFQTEICMIWYPIFSLAEKLVVSL